MYDPSKRLYKVDLAAHFEAGKLEKEPNRGRVVNETLFDSRIGNIAITVSESDWNDTNKPNAFYEYFTWRDA